MRHSYSGTVIYMYFLVVYLNISRARVSRVNFFSLQPFFVPYYILRSRVIRVNGLSTTSLHFIFSILIFNQAPEAETVFLHCTDVSYFKYYTSTIQTQ